MGINTIVGQAATGDNYFQRSILANDFWRNLKSGSNILIAAPRRVGKSSFLFHIHANPLEEFIPIYIISEAINNSNEFFNKLYSHTFDLVNGIQKYITQIKNFAKKNRINEISKNGIKFDGKSLDYFDAFIKLFDILDLKNKKIVIMIDEFAATVQNILTDENNNAAKRFLQKNRELRHLPQLKNKVLFVYAGSIGLENIADNINASNTINDLYHFNIPPFTRDEAKTLIYDVILKNSEMKLKNDVVEYLLDKIQWLIPFYIQLLMDEIYKIYSFEKEKKISKSIVDNAIKKAIQYRNYFDLWLNRLRISYKGNDYNFIKDVLNLSSKKGVITSLEIHDLAVKYELASNYKNIINSIVYDGYINNSDNAKKYRFNSPIVQIWWRDYVAE